MLALVLVVLAGCGGPQSALDPAGESARQLADLFWTMSIGAIGVWLVVVGVGLYSLLRPETGSRRKAAVFIIGGGVVVPTFLLGVLLAYALWMLPGQVAPAPDGSLEIEVVGYQWWWQVRYPGDESAIVSANEIHLPVGEAVNIYLTSADVIHSFWVPSLGGKVDMIPGRRTRLTLRPTRTGTFYGVCAEYCGGAHARMGFRVVVQEPDDFRAWLSGERGDAAAPADPAAERGGDLFLRHGCGACHQIRGTVAAGQLGPDLTHLAGRQTLAAAALPMNRRNLLRWLRHPDRIKPGTLMPHYNMLPVEDLEALVTYLESLR